MNEDFLVCSETYPVEMRVNSGVVRDLKEKVKIILKIRWDHV